MGRCGRWRSAGAPEPVLAGAIARRKGSAQGQVWTGAPAPPHSVIDWSNDSHGGAGLMPWPNTGPGGGPADPATLYMVLLIWWISRALHGSVAGVDTRGHLLAALVAAEACG
eukprot:363625-Chlamydomonas_euryale.AAC.5